MMLGQPYICGEHTSLKGSSPLNGGLLAPNSKFFT
jgi:hypothetical protein